MASESEQKFEKYNWEADEVWQRTMNGMEMPPSWSESKQQEYILTKKRKHYQTIDPSYKIPESPKKPSSSYQRPADSTSNYNNNENTNQNDDTKTNTNTSDSSSRSTNSRSSSSSSSSSSVTSFFKQRIRNMLNYFYIISEWFIFFNCLISIVRPSSHYRALTTLAIAHLVASFQNNGMPRFNMYYAQKLLLDENAMVAFYGLIFLMGPPSFAFLLPVILRSLFMACFCTNNLVASWKMPIFSKTISPLLKRVISQREWLNQNIAMMEVLVGFYLIFTCFYAPRSIILLIIYWQIIHSRYMMNNQNIRSAFYIINLKIESILTNIPVVLNLYRKLTSYLAKSVDPELLRQTMDQGNQRRCTIM